MAPACGRVEVGSDRIKTTQRLYRCHNAHCHVGWIDRDANAARNIAQVGYAMFRTQQRPAEFTKAHHHHQAAKKAASSNSSDGNKAIA